ncbi:MAG: extracellular solute-binding protein, partial [Anaerolineae bacterium]
MQHKHTIFILWFLILLSACDLIPSNETNVATATPTVTPTPVVTPALQSTPAIAVPITTTQAAPSLTIWLPPGTVLGSEAGTALFSDQLLAFNAGHPDLETHVEQKTVTGQGGILSYLRTGSTVAPSILPDLVALPTNQLATAVNEGLIYPLNDLIDPALFDDLYPAAKTMAQVGDQYYGYPFAITNLTHLAYQTSVITTTPPLRWDDLAANVNTPFIFPADGPA